MEKHTMAFPCHINAETHLKGHKQIEFLKDHIVEVAEQNEICRCGMEIMLEGWCDNLDNGVANGK